MPNSIALSAYRTTNLCVRSIADVSLNVGKVGGGIFSRIFGARSECLSIQVRNKHTDIKLNKVYNDINKSIQ